MGDDELVSLNQIHKSFETDDLELVTTTNALVEITIYPEKNKRGDLNVRLHFGRVDGAINKQDPSYAYVAFLEWANTPEDVQTVFGISPSERIWSSQGREGMDFTEAWTFMENSGHEIVCVKKRAVEIALYHAQDDEGNSLPGVGIQLHFGDIDAGIDEKSKAYDCPAWMDSNFAPSMKGMFSLDDIPIAFGIDPDKKMWIVGDPG